MRAAYPVRLFASLADLRRSTDRFSSIVFCPADRLLPVVPVVRPTVKFQPIWAGDVGRAVAVAALDPKLAAGQLYELAGPEVISME